MRGEARGPQRGKRSAEDTPGRTFLFSPPLAPCRPPGACRAVAGFTLLEIILVLFLFVAMLTMTIPRIVPGEDLGATGRQFIGALRSLQSMAGTLQKPVKLYVDLDQRSYWAVLVEGREEKPPLDATWATPHILPESIRFSDISIGQLKRSDGRIDLLVYPNGRIDSGLFHMTDATGHVLAIAIEAVTGAIRTSDARIEPVRKPPIPDRIKPLLQATAVPGGPGASSASRF